MKYYASVHRPGPVRYGDLPFSVGVLPGPGEYPTIGLANPWMWDADRRQTWKLRVGGRELPGLYVLVDGEFVPAQEGGPAPPSWG